MSDRVDAKTAKGAAKDAASEEVKDVPEPNRVKTSKSERPKTNKGADILIVEPAEERPKTKAKEGKSVNKDVKEESGGKDEKEEGKDANDGHVQKVRDRVSDGKKIESGNIETNLNDDGDLIIDKDKCRFYIFGCDVEGNDHESKRPVKHLTVLNDAVIDKFRVINKVLDDDDKITSMFHTQKISTNSILCRESVQLVWPIAGFNEVLRKGKNRLGEVLVSEPFRSECFGYQLQAILIPYGKDNELNSIPLGRVETVDYRNQ
uniref:Ulp1 protease family, C-terminal catalytic domain-containing protein n=1 Tax=Bursaphelenchus xylophilus TaxID=6326 RepID=A0A1I7RP76_BURXY